MSLLQPVQQILKVRAWFVPSTFKPPSVLETKLTSNFWLNFDYGLYHFGLMSDRLEGVFNSIHTKSPTQKRSRLKRLYDYLITAFMLFNVLRLFAAFFVKDPYWCMMFGDFSHNWIKKRHISNGPMLFLGIYALVLQMLFCYYSETGPKLRLWLVPFAIFRGALSPADANIRSVHQLVIIWTMILASLFYGSAILGYGPELYHITVPWATLETVWAYYLMGIITWSLGYFHTLCFYLRVRYKRLNYIVRYMREERTLSTRKRNEFMKEVVYHHDLTSNDIGYWNRFWKFYALATYFCYLPLEFWLLYSAIWVESSGLACTAFWVLFFQFALFLGIVIGSGESVSNQAHLSYRWLNFLCIQEYPVHLKLKLCALIERLGGPTIGFTCYDFFTVARETFYDVRRPNNLFHATLFLLVVDFVVSYL